MNNSNEKRKQVLLAAFKEAVSDVMPVVASITAFASVAKLMDKFGMIQGVFTTFVACRITGVSGPCSHQLAAAV